MNCEVLRVRRFHVNKAVYDAEKGVVDVEKLRPILGIPIVTGLGLSDSHPVVAPGQQEFRATCFQNGNEAKKTPTKLEQE